MKEGIKYGAKKCLERGMTTVHDIVQSPEEVRAYQEVYAEGALPIRVHLLVRVYESQIKAEDVLRLRFA